MKETLRSIDLYFLQKDEPARSCLQYLRAYILKRDEKLVEAWKYGMPFYCYRGKMFCYLWVHRKFGQPYIGFVDGNRVSYPGLLAEKRARMKIFLIDPDKNIPLGKLNALFSKVFALYGP